MTDTFTFTREDGSTLVLTDDPSTDSPFVVSGFSPYLKADLVSAYNQTGYGEVGALDVEGGRPMSITVNVKGWPFTQDQVTAAIEELDAFTQPSLEDIYLAWDVDGTERGRWVRSQGLTDQSATEQKFGSKMRLDLRALDPRSYGPEITETVDATPATVVLGGNRPSSNWRIECPGPCTNPTVDITLADGSVNHIVVTGGAPSGSTFVFDGRTDEVFAYVTATGVPTWLGIVAEDSGGRGAVLWPVGPGDVAVTFHNAESAAGTFYGRPAY